MIATAVSLRLGHEKLTLFSWSDKDTKTGRSGNARQRISSLFYFKASDKLLQHLVDKIFKNVDLAVIAMPGC